MPNGIQPFKEFVDSINDIKLENAQTLPQSLVADEDSLKEMKQHLVSLYDGVDCNHSFLDEAGQVFDCIPIEHQPSLRGKDVVLPKPPELPDFPGEKTTETDNSPSIFLSPERRDALGNAMWCEPGMIPMRRVTLEEMARFGSLNNFLQKSPGGGKHPKSNRAADVNSVHRYAHGYQNVINKGAFSSLSVWQPAVDRDQDQNFSLSQIWVMGEGDGENSLQTVESGWHVFPIKYNNSKLPILFILWTPDNYLSGGYNLDGPGFIQTNNSVALGSAVPGSISIPGEEPNYISLAFWKFDNWYYYFGTLQKWVNVGYYPLSIFGGGKLTINADRIDFGGETDCELDAVFAPPMGSGAFASAGFGFAASHSNMSYLDLNGGNQNPNLISEQLTPNLYTFQNGAYTIYFGGPGGIIRESE